MNELYKLFVKQKIWIFIMILFVLRIVTVCIIGYDSHYMIDENEKYYHEYMQKYQGKITKDKQKEIEKEYDKISLSGNELLASEQKNKAFQVLFDQYNYQKEKGSGYILETRGWQSILEHDNIDFCLVLCIIIVMSALWGMEYETEMDIMLRTCKKGKYCTPLAKVTIGVVVSFILSILFQMVQFIYLMGKVGLEHSSYPIQSLEYFQNTQYHISLGWAVAIIGIMRLIGAVLLALLVMLVNVWVKRKTISMIVNLAIMVIVAIICKNGSIIYCLPFPLGALRAVGYLWPSQFQYRYVGDESVKMCIFSEISRRTFIIMCVVYFMEILILGSLCILSFSKWRAKGIHLLKKMNRTVCLIFCGLVLTGCGADNQSISVSIEKDDTQAHVEWKDKKIAIDYDNNNIVYLNQNGEKENLIRDVFPSDLSIQKLFVYEDNCYYLSEKDESSGVCIRKINLKNFDNTLVYDSTDENIEDYFGIVQKHEQYDEIFDDLEETKWFFITNDYIYWKKKYYVVQVNIKNGNKKIVSDGIADERITYEKGILQYINAEGNKENVKCE